MKKESTFFWTSLFLEARAEILKNVLLVFSILVETMIPKGHFEINLPLWNSLYSRKKQIFGKPPFTFECVLKCKNIVSNSWFTTLCEKVKSISNVFYDYLLWGVHCYTRGNYNIGTWQSSRLLLSWRSAIFLPKQNCCFYFRAIFKFEWQCFSLSSPMLRFHGIFLFCRKSGFKTFVQNFWISNRCLQKLLFLYFMARFKFNQSNRLLMCDSVFSYSTSMLHFQGIL